MKRKKSFRLAISEHRGVEKEGFLKSDFDFLRALLKGSDSIVGEHRMNILGKDIGYWIIVP